MRRILGTVPWLLLAVAVGVAGWIGVDIWQAVREANEEPVAASTTTAPPTTTSTSTTTSSTTSTPTTVPASALDGIVLYTADDCYRCDFLQSRLGDLAGEVPLWVRPAEEGMIRLPVVVVQFGGDVAGRWEGQVAVNSAEAIASLAVGRWPEWVAFAATSTTTIPGGSTTTLPGGYTTFNWGGKPAEPGFLTCGEFTIGDRIIEGAEVCYLAVFVDTPYVSDVLLGDGGSYEFVLLPVSTALPGEDTGVRKALVTLPPYAPTFNLGARCGVWLGFDPASPRPTEEDPTYMEVPWDEAMTSLFRPDRLYPIALVTKMNPEAQCAGNAACIDAWDVRARPLIEEGNAPLVTCLRDGVGCDLAGGRAVGELRMVCLAPDYNPAWLD